MMTTTTTKHVLAAAQQQKTTFGGFGALMDQASRTLIETQLCVALDAVCYQRGARKTTTTSFFFCDAFDFEF